MNIEELTQKEFELYSKVSQLQGTIDYKNEQISLLGISDEYKMIHKEYAKICEQNIEALKRGLFISWFSISEPTFLTGISELDKNAEEKIISKIDKKIKTKSLDSELNWMIDYYKDWNYVFENFKNFESFYSKINSEEITEMPKYDKQEMKSRGQMGIYWSSLQI